MIKNYRYSVVVLVLAGASTLLFQNCSSGLGSKVSFSEAPASRYELITPFCREIEPGKFQIKQSYHWSESTEFPEYNQIMSTPTVGDLDQDGIPEIAFVTFRNGEKPYSSTAVLRVINGLTKQEVFSVGDPDLMPKVSTPLLIDIDADGKAEIVYAHSSNNFVIALNHDGTLRWKTSVLSGINHSGLAAFDLMNNGKAEIIAGNEVLRENRLEDGSYEVRKISFNESTRRSLNGFATSIGGKPVLISSLGAQLYNSNGTFTTLFEVTDAACGDGCYPSVADVDPASPGPEFIFTGAGLFRVYDQLGNILIDKDLTEHFPEDTCTSRNTVGGGQATVGNFDSDPETVEIAIATGRSLTIFNSQGDKIAGSQTRDCSSLATGVTSFDFNGDGSPEILYSDELKFRIYQMTGGNDLEIVYEIENTTGTLVEYPVVADVTGDSRPEILVVSNDYGGIANWEGALHGLRIFEAPSNDLEESWMPTRSVWNQHSYFVYNVSDQLQAANAQSPFDASLGTSFKRNIPGAELRCRTESVED